MRVWKITFVTISILTLIVWLAVASFPTKKLKLVTCDVGQGDAILGEVGTFQFLVDGGPNAKVIDCLSRYMPFWDRTIEVVILTHPQEDHLAGLIEVFRRYKVDTFLTSPLNPGTQIYKVLEKEVGGNGARVVNPVTGSHVRYDKLSLDIVWPSKEFLASVGFSQGSKEGQGVLGAFTSDKDPNSFSVITNVSFGDFDAILTGDIEQEEVLILIKENLLHDVDYIKIPHHGSKNGLNKELLDIATPEVAVISVGKGNRYGHPNAEVLDLLKLYDVEIKRTDLEGDVVVIADGVTWEVKTGK